MALTVSLTPFTVNLTTSVATVVDATTGYGTRSNYGVFTKAYKLDYLGALSSFSTTGSVADPAVDLSWTFSYTTDGWWQIWYIAAPLYAGGTSYAQYDAVYSTSDKSVYTSLSAGNLGHTPASSPTFWVKQSDPTSLINLVGTAQAPANVVTNTGYAVVNTILYALTTYNYGNLAASASLEPCSDCKRTWDVTQLQIMRTYLDGLQIASQRQDYSNGEKICRRAITLASIPAL